MASQMKISFGFSKVSKTPSVNVPQKPKLENDVQYIDCLEENSIKLVNNEKKEEAALIIPLKNENLLRDKMIETYHARQGKLKAEKSRVEENGTDNKPLTLDDLAAKEIMEDLKNANKDHEEEKRISEIPLNSIILEGEVESTLDDYDNVPINEFGMALLRGMGWQPEKGIGKNGKIVKPIEMVLRPKGMALGADKAFKTPAQQSYSKEELTMKVSAPVKVLSGQYKDMYGKIESFNDLIGRLLIRLTLTSEIVSVNENMIQLVTLKEFQKNSKVMNLKDYNNFRDEKRTSEVKEKRNLSYDSKKNKQEPRSSKGESSRRDSSESRRHSDRRDKPRSGSPSDHSRYRKEKYGRSESSSSHYKTSSRHERENRKKDRSHSRDSSRERR